MADVVRDYLVAEVEKLTGRPWPQLRDEIVARTRLRHPELGREPLTDEREAELLRRLYLHESAAAARLERDRHLIDDAVGLLGGLDL